MKAERPFVLNWPAKSDMQIIPHPAFAEARRHGRMAEYETVDI